MKLNYECLRKLLLTLEETIVIDNNLQINSKSLNEIAEKMTEFSKPDILYTSMMAMEAKLIDSHIFHEGINEESPVDCVYFVLTYEGHQFLDTVRDNSIWGKTKKILSKVGAISTVLLISVAQDVIKAKLVI